MIIRKFLFGLFLLLGLPAAFAQSNPDYGKLLWGGTYTWTGTGFQGMDTAFFGAPFIFDMQIYENVLIFNKNDRFNYVGRGEAYYVQGRKYKSTTADLYFIITDNGVPFLISVTTQNYPFVGNITTTSLVFINIGDTRNSIVGGAVNGGANFGNGGMNSGGTFNTQPRQRNCNHCHGTGWCPNCNGSGWVVSPYGNVKGQYPCVNCNPNGNNRSKGKCPLCGGLGKR